MSATGVRLVRHTLCCLLLAAAFEASAAGVPDAGTAWQRVTSADGSAPSKRHEAGAVAVDGRLYLLGGRGTRPLEVYDPATRRWRDLGPLPDELHHFQPVAIGTRIYLVGAMRCCYPDEPIERTVHVYDTDGGVWSTAGSMPAARARGGAGTVVRDGLIYLVGGNRFGHDGGAVPWFDVFDPANRTWRSLPDAPNARDHFAAVIAGDRLVAAGGRTTDLPDPFDKAVAATDVYDFESGRWTEGADIPTRRAGTMSFAAGGEVVVVGGEIDGRAPAYRTAESYVVAEDRWRTLAPMIDARHGGGGVLIGDTLHAVAGSARQGGGPEITAHETLALTPLPVDTDADGDGLDDSAEREVWRTDPDKADTDEDGLDDGEETRRGTDPLVADSDTDGLADGAEIALGTDPLLADTDEDGLDDGAERTMHESDPLRADSDEDGLGDGAEIDLGTDPLLADTDEDGLDDGEEVNEHRTSPTRADSDADRLSDGAEVIEHGTDPLLADTDEDGLDDIDELLEHGTDPLRADSDGDGLDDSREIALGTDPRVTDSDFDGVPDGRDADPLSAPARAGGGGAGGGGAVWLMLVALGAVRLARRLARTA